jgi:hypothetical protein
MKLFMNLGELQSKLIAAARVNAPDDKVPYAFEKRIAALLKSRVAPKSMDLWVRGLWRSAISCTAIAILCGTWAVLTPASSASPTADLSQDFQNTLLASVDQSDVTP